MSRQVLLPERLGEVHAERRTPHLAVMLLLLVVVPLALFGTITELATATVLLLLLVFAVVNGALFILKRRRGEPEGYFELPLAVPALGALVCLGLVAVRIGTGDWKAPAIAGGLLAGAVVLYALLRHRLAIARP